MFGGVIINLDFYEDLLNKYTKEQDALDKLSNKMSSYRFIVCALAVASLSYIFFVDATMYAIVSLVILVTCFIFLVYKHLQAKQKLEKVRCKIIINQKYISRIQGDWINFKKNGSEFIDDENPYTSDLDIFGEKSLFQFINETNTFFGKESLKKILDPSEKSVKEILKRQDAVKELSKLNEFCQDVKCEGLMSREVSNNPDKLIEFLESDEKIFKKTWMKYVVSSMPVITVCLPLLIYVSPSQPKQTLFISLFLMQCALHLIYFPKLLKILNEVSHFKKSINNFKSMLIAIEEQNFTSSLNQEMQKSLKSEKVASKCVKKLENISDAIDIRYNSLLYIFLNIFLLWDFHCVFALEDLRDNGGNDIKKWLKTIGDFETLISLAVIPQTHSDWVYPSFNNDNLKISAKSLGHPLINNDNRVYNDISLENIAIISGSNMSGKTTFLRTLGINLTLAYAGAPVCASQFSAPVVDIYTSMRIQDDLKANVSTFYAELTRIKKIIDNSSLRTPMIFLIDEIFRGTNSYDRIFGAEKVLLQLKKPWIIGAISTHDLEVCRLEDNDSIFTNYHFSESYSNNKISFDYKIKDGVSTTRNARYLMKMVGIDIEDD